ncbi:MAG: lipoate--protein ligase [Spirochaetaceae bacterium]|nr:lipoate--protein ligase [Spirochaetaceae bacterium]
MEPAVFVEPKSTDAAFHFSAEEYLARRFPGNSRVFMIWQAENCAMLGRNQIAHAEVDIARAVETGVHLVRRSSGGGTIFTDMGTLLISAISAFREGDDAKQMLGMLSGPLVSALGKFGVRAYTHSRNDIFVEGKKVSGMAQYIRNGVLVSHCSLLFDTDLDRLTTVLRADPGKIVSKALASMRSHVTNISEYMPVSRTTGEFKDMLKASFFEDMNLKEYELTEEDIKKIHGIRLQKYANSEWNIGSEPRFSYSNSRRFPGGKVEVRLYAERGLIKNCALSGDFLALLPIRELEEKIEGLPYRAGAVRDSLASADLAPYLGTVTLEELLSCAFD